MKIDDANLIIDKAKTKKNGVYSFRGYMYVVKDNSFVGFSDYFGNIYQRAGNFNVSLD